MSPFSSIIATLFYVSSLFLHSTINNKLDKTLIVGMLRDLNNLDDDSKIKEGILKSLNKQMSNEELEAESIYFASEISRDYCHDGVTLNLEFNPNPKCWPYNFNNHRFKSSTQHGFVVYVFMLEEANSLYVLTLAAKFLSSSFTLACRRRGHSTDYLEKTSKDSQKFNMIANDFDVDEYSTNNLSKSITAPCISESDDESISSYESITGIACVKRRRRRNIEIVTTEGQHELKTSKMTDVSEVANDAILSGDQMKKLIKSFTSYEKREHVSLSTPRSYSVCTDNEYAEKELLAWFDTLSCLVQGTPRQINSGSEGVDELMYHRPNFMHDSQEKIIEDTEIALKEYDTLKNLLIQQGQIIQFQNL